MFGRLFNVRCSMFNVQCSMFDVRSPLQRWTFDVQRSMFGRLFDVRCSMFDVRCSVASSPFNIRSPRRDLVHNAFRHRMPSMGITYQLEPDLSVDEFIDVLRRSTLAERRPVDELETMRGMLSQADIIVTRTDRRAVARRLARHFRFQLLHIFVRPRGRYCVSAPGHWPHTDPTHARSSGAPYNTHSSGGPQGRGILPPHRFPAPRFVLDGAALLISPDPLARTSDPALRPLPRAGPASAATRGTARHR